MTATEEKTVSAIVRRGTVWAEVVMVKGWDHALNKEAQVAKSVNPKGPGETVSVSESEAVRLRALGFLYEEGQGPGDEPPSGSPGLVQTLPHGGVGLVGQHLWGGVPARNLSLLNDSPVGGG